jgi:hypothetical protein
MPTVNGPDEITDLEAGNDKVFYSDSSGDVTEVALGAAATVLTSSGATSAPTFSVIPADSTVGANKAMYTNNSDVESGVAFGAAGTVLTSGGTDATATPPTWEAAASGSEITLNSSAAIALGKFVVLETAGTVKEVSASTSIVLAFGTKSTATIGTALLWGQQEPSVTWDPTRNVFWCTCMAQASNNIVVYIMEISSAGVVSIAHVTTYSASGIGTYGQQASSVDTTNDKLVMYWRYSNGYMYGVAAPLSGTGGTSTVGAWSSAVLQGYGQYSWTGVPVKTLYVAATDRTYCFFTNQSQYAMFGVLDTSAATPVWTSTGSWVDGVFTNQYYGWDAALAANGNICLVGGANSSYAGITAYSITPLASGGTYQGYAQVQSGGIGSTQGVAVVYDASEGKMVGYGVGNHYKYYVSTWVIPATGAPNTVSTVLDVEAGLTSAFAYTSRIRPPLGYDDVNGVVVIGYRLTSTSMIQFDQVVTSATNPTMFGSAIASTMSYANWPNFGLGQGYTGSWIGFAGLWGTDPGGYPVAAASVSTNNTKQIGIAQNAVAGAAAAVTIKTLGALDETQTGMTVGDIYIDQNGAPSSSIGSYGTLVGRAIASDKLLITETGSGTV